MGIFGTSSPFDQDVEKATSETNTSEEWGLMMEICDRAGASPAAAKDCLRAVLRRLAHADPHVQVLAATLLDACVSNCGRVFLLEVASREFEAEFRRLMSRAQPPVAARLRALLRKWAEGEFSSDPQLDLIPSLHRRLRAESDPSSAPGPASSSAAAVAAAPAAQQEQEDLARAIALSLREAPSAAATPASLYPRVDVPAPSPAPPPPARKVRALYDFEAAEDNELTFFAGEIVHVTDSSDPNWWKGHNERGEGLFPANFVTLELSEPRAEARAEPRKSVQWAVEPADEAAAPDEAEMDAALGWLLEADPAAAARDEAPARAREQQVANMAPAVDRLLQAADSRHARLTQLSAELVDALNLYHELMRDPKPAHYPPPHYYMPAHPPPRC